MSELADLPDLPEQTITLEGSARDRFEQLHHILRERICLLYYAPGERLREEALAAEFGVSRTPLRRVLGRLETEGLLLSVQSVGTLVTDIDLDALWQVYELRMELNELSGRLSPVPPDADTLAAFRDLHRRARAMVADPDLSKFGRINIDFFETCQKLTGNEPLREVTERLFYQTSRIWLKYLPEMDFGAEIATFAREITEVHDAVAIGDLQAAAYIRRAHLSMSFSRLRDHRE